MWEASFQVYLFEVSPNPHSIDVMKVLEGENDPCTKPAFGYICAPKIDINFTLNQCNFKKMSKTKAKDDFLNHLKQLLDMITHLNHKLKMHNLEALSNQVDERTTGNHK